MSHATHASRTRTESDAMGPIDVPADRYWGAQTERSLHHFPFGENMPRHVIVAMAMLKRACATVNHGFGKLSKDKLDLIARAADEVIDGRLDDHFPLKVWQTGSGTQTNMNVNEVISNRAIEMAGGTMGTKQPIHPNDDVNMSQSSNDTFPTALHASCAIEVERSVIPAVERLRDALAAKSREFDGIVKIGRTHLQDAVPLTVGQEISGWVAQLDTALQAIRATLPLIRELAIGGTAVGTGLNAPAEFGERVSAELAKRSGIAFTSAPNKFQALAGHENVAAVHGCLAALAAGMMKIANDVRWLSSGPRCGLGELVIPENEPGSSIMPGKVNPTQSESMTMVCVQVMANNQAILTSASQGNFELNVFKPVIALNFLRSCELITGTCDAFREFCAEGLTVDRKQIHDMLHRSLMLVTALAPHIGYDKASAIAKHAHHEGMTLKEAALALGWVDADTYDRIVQPADMVRPG